MEQDPINKLELAILHVVRDMTSEQLAKRVPDIPAMDYRRITYCLIEDRIAAYKASNAGLTLGANSPSLKERDKRKEAKEN